MLAGWAISKIVSFVAKGIDELAHSAENCKERVDELISSYKSSLDTVNSNAKKVDELAGRYETLSKGVDGLGQNISLTAEEYEEYNSIVNEIADMFPELIQGYINEGNAILSLKGNVEQLTQACKDAQQEAYNLAISGESDVIKNLQNTLSTKATGFFDGIKQIFKREFAPQETIEIISRLYEAYSKSEEDYKKEYEKLYADLYLHSSGTGLKLFNLNKTLSDIGFSSSVLSQEEKNNIHNNVKAAIQTYQSEIDSAASNVKEIINAHLNLDDTFKNMTPEVQSAVSILANSIDSSMYEELTSSNFAIGSYVQTILSSVSKNEEVQNALVDLFTLDTSDKSVNDIQSEIDDYIKTIATAIGEEDVLALKVRLGVEDIVPQNLVNNIKNKLKGTEFDDKVGELTLSDLQIAVDLGVDDDSILSWDELIERIEETKKEIETLTPFSLSESQSKAIDDYQSKVSTLGKALAELQSGEWENSEFVDLIQEFPELADEADNLEYAITKLINDSIVDVRWKNFNLGISQLDGFADELSDVISLLGDGKMFKEGEITDLGITKSLYDFLLTSTKII